MRSEAKRDAMPGGTPGPASGCAQAGDPLANSRADNNVNTVLKTHLMAVAFAGLAKVTTPLPCAGQCHPNRAFFSRKNTYRRSGPSDESAQDGPKASDG